MGRGRLCCQRQYLDVAQTRGRTTWQLCAPPLHMHEFARFTSRFAFVCFRLFFLTRETAATSGAVAVILPPSAKTGATFGIRESCCTTCCITWCCSVFSECQVAREIKSHRGVSSQVRVANNGIRYRGDAPSERIEMKET